MPYPKFCGQGPKGVLTMERMPSIFNDVLSPVTPGPSSSNTCGPYRIARLARALLGEMPRPGGPCGR